MASRPAYGPALADAIPNRPTNASYCRPDRIEPPEVTGRYLAEAQAGLEHYRTREKKEGALIRREAGCSAQCRPCYFQCAIMTACVWRLWNDHQAALAACGGTLTHKGQVYSISAGEA